MKQYLQEIFYVLTSALLVFGLLEIFRPGMVIAYFNYNLILIFWLIIGIVILFVSNENRKKL